MYHGARFGGDQVSQGVCCVVAADAFLVRIHFEDVFGTGWIVLEGWQRLDEALAAFVN